MARVGKRNPLREERCGINRERGRAGKKIGMEERKRRKVLTKRGKESLDFEKIDIKDFWRCPR